MMFFGAGRGSLFSPRGGASIPGFNLALFHLALFHLALFQLALYLFFTLVKAVVRVSGLASVKADLQCFF